ncbi:glutathione S-transferase [Altererythrobacter sp. CC-YST694]|uniref:glutathione S-transferase family protein n=1 Tax=Altererythrobacter sp. CC-YST694 TaxID=2755038 RepID=UPI001D03223C|nr:glutathione S-transferase [Altererythrobacter sp. CC-YST694]MCB5426150.1 glutathione S-transferase [Altererythrobacter sp. CC-YST694]
MLVHHLNNSRSQRILWMLEELGLPYEVRRYERDPKTLFAPSQLKQLHPLGKSPMIEDEGQVIVESGSIVEYLVEKTGGRLGPEGERDAALRYRMFLHYAEGSVMPPLLLKLVLSRIPIMGRFAIRRIQPMIDVHLDFIESELAQRPWFAGDAMTAADIMMSFPIEAAYHRGGLDQTRPSTLKWLNKIQARPAYRRAIEVGGPYAYG